MTRRRGELTIQKIKRTWPYSVVVPREVFDCSVPIDAAYPSMAPRHEGVLTNGRDLVRVFFKDKNEANVFASRAGAEEHKP